MIVHSPVLDLKAMDLERTAPCTIPSVGMGAQVFEIY